MNEEIIVEPTTEVIKKNGHGSPPVAARHSPATARRRNWFVIGSLIGLIVVGVAAPVFHSAYTHESTDNAFIDGDVVALSAKVANPITKVYVNDNQMVKAGD